MATTLPAPPLGTVRATPVRSAGQTEPASTAQAASIAAPDGEAREEIYDSSDSSSSDSDPSSDADQEQPQSQAQSQSITQPISSQQEDQQQDIPSQLRPATLTGAVPATSSTPQTSSTTTPTVRATTNTRERDRSRTPRGNPAASSTIGLTFESNYLFRISSVC